MLKRCLAILVLTTVSAVAVPASSGEVSGLRPDGSAEIRSPLPAASLPLAAVDPSVRGQGFAQLVSQITGVAISPLLGIGAVGAWDYFNTEDKTKLSWYAQPWFWMSALVLVALVAAKDALGAAVPVGWKKPLDVADAVENKVTALLATGAFLPIIVDQFSKYLASSASSAAVSPSAGAMPIAFIEWSWLLTVLMLPLAVAVFLAVWLLSHSINVLILISPWGQVDAALKALRTSVFGLIGITAVLDPWTSALLSGVIILLALLLAGWAFRLTVFGSVFCWDFFTLRTLRNRVGDRVNRAFAGRRLPGVPHRTLGSLAIADDGRVVFRYRPWLVAPKRETEVDLSRGVLGRGLVHPVVTSVENATEKPRHLLTFPPRYRGHEDELQRLYRIPDQREAGLLKGWAWLRDALGFGRVEPARANA